MAGSRRVSSGLLDVCGPRSRAVPGPAAEEELIDHEHQPDVHEQPQHGSHRVHRASAHAVPHPEGGHEHEPRAHAHAHPHPLTLGAGSSHRAGSHASSHRAGAHAAHASAHGPRGGGSEAGAAHAPAGSSAAARESRTRIYEREAEREREHDHSLAQAPEGVHDGADPVEEGLARGRDGGGGFFRTGRHSDDGGGRLGVLVAGRGGHGHGHERAGSRDGGRGPPIGDREGGLPGDALGGDARWRRDVHE
mmetsp:Transcript_9849/g.44853  ORF Transcript_9849/g.44853 Transcript_9849/m.44853 type:complete len:249 (+) Transcript_9849:3428-4174(+)